MKTVREGTVGKDLEFRILVDNRSRGELVTEHGFAVWVEAGERVILFDTGQSGALFANAEAMGCDLRRVDMLVLSHGHYDHTGAIRELLALNPSIRVFCHPQALVPSRYSIYPGQAPRQIAMPALQRKALEALAPQQLIQSTGPLQLLPGIGLSGAIPRDHPLEDTGGPFFLDEGGEHPDFIEDDLSMWFRTKQGLIVLTGCCHAGLINTVQHIRDLTGEQRIYGILGGLHLRSASTARLQATCDALIRWHPDFVIASHCTGDEASAFLGDQLEGIVTPGYCGMVKHIG